MADQVYDGFISYSHAADGLLAPRLQAGLQRFAKPWWKRRVVRVFRDESSLSANPHLWSSITDALDTSGWFVLLLSPDAARSEWVNQEIAYWKTHRDPSRILPVVTDGEFGWADRDVIGDAVPDQLKGVFAAEPRWVDLRFARGEEHLDLKNPRFSAAVADVASALRGVPKDELESEEVKQHRQTIRTAWTGVAAIGVLAIVATGFGIQSASNAAEAERQAEIALQNEQQAEANAAEAQRQAEIAAASAAAESAAREEADQNAQLARARELTASAVAVVDQDPELGLLLALHAIGSTQEDVELPTALRDVMWQGVLDDRLVAVIETGSDGFVSIDLSEDGDWLAVAQENDATVEYRTANGQVSWSYSEVTTDSFTNPVIDPDGRRLAVSVVDSTSFMAATGHPADELDPRVVVLETSDGTVVDVFSYPDCEVPRAHGWSPDGAYFIVSHLDECPRDGVPADRSWLEIRNGSTLELISVIDANLYQTLAVFDDAGRLYVSGGGPLEVFEASTFELVGTVDGLTGSADVSGDGAVALHFNPGDSSQLAVFDLASGVQIDLLRPVSAFPRFPDGHRLSPDGKNAIVATEGEGVVIWNLGTGDMTHVLRGGPSTSAAMSPDGRQVYSGHVDGTIKVWSLAPSGGLDSPGDLGSHRYVNGDSFSVGTEVGSATAVDLGEFAFKYVWFDATTGEIIFELEGATDEVPVALSSGEFLVALDDGRWVVLDPSSGAIQHQLGCTHSEEGECIEQGLPGPYSDFVGSLDGSELVAGTDEGIVFVHPGDGSLVSPVGVELEGVVAFTDTWILGVEGLDLVSIERETGSQLARLPAPQPEIAGAAVSVDGTVIALFPFGGTEVTVVDTVVWQTNVVRADVGRVRGFGLSGDGSTLALGGEESIHILDLQTGVHEYSIPIAGASDFHWLDNDLLLVGTRDGIWATAPTTDEAIQAQARAGLSRSFTEEECGTYRIDPCPSLEELQGG